MKLDHIEGRDISGYQHELRASDGRITFHCDEPIDGRLVMAILIVDNDVSVLRSFARLLSSHGYSIRVAADGSEALERALERNPDVILMDLHMPVMDGIAAARAIKAHPQLERTAIIGITVMPSDRERNETSFDCVLYKPCPAADLIAAIEKVRR